MIKVHSYVPIYEQNGKAVKTPTKTSLTVSSHWNRREFVILHLAEGITFAVNASDLIAAVKNAQNTNRF